MNEVSHRRENVEAGIQRATAALEMAKLNLSYTVVVAPCDGKLGRRALEEGQYISCRADHYIYLAGYSEVGDCQLQRDSSGKSGYRSGSKDKGGCSK